MAGGKFYTVVMQQTNKSFPRRLQLGKMKEKQKVKAIHRYRQQEVLFTGYVGCGKSALLRAVVHHDTLRTCSLHSNGEIVMFMGVGKGKPKGSYPAKFIIVDSSGYNEESGGVVRFVLAHRPNLRRVFLMVDASKGLQDEDRSLLEYMGGLPTIRAEVQPVLTKVDLIAPEERTKIAEQIFEEIKKTSPWLPAPILTCARKENQTGIEEIRRSIAQAIQLPYEEAWAPRGTPRHKTQPLRDATNEQRRDAEDGAEPSARPARVTSLERRRAVRVERAEREASTEGEEERTGQVGTERPQRARKRQTRHAIRDEAAARWAEAEAGRRHRAATGFGMKQMARERTAAET